MENETNEAEKLNDQNKAALKKDAHGLFQSLKKFLVLVQL